jgi:hypothetical protein
MPPALQPLTVFAFEAEGSTHGKVLGHRSGVAGFGGRGVLVSLCLWGELPAMAMYWGHAPESDPFYQAVKFSATMNRYAAGFSGASALCMGVGLIIRQRRRRD